MAYIIPTQKNNINNNQQSNNTNIDAILNSNNKSPIIQNSLFNTIDSILSNDNSQSNNTNKTINNDSVQQKEEQKRKEQQYKEMQKNKRVDELLMQQKNDLINLIFEGYTLTTVNYKNFTIRIRSVTPDEADQAYHDASFYDEDFFYAAYRLFILSTAIESINDYNFSGKQECYTFLRQLSLRVINDIYNLFLENIEYQNFLVANMDSLYKLVEDSFCRIKYKVMRAFNCLPTEKRCKEMGDAQWLWLYYNIQEDMLEEFDNTQDNLDYIGFYINSDAAKQITKNSAARRKKRMEQRKKKFRQITNRDRQYIISKLNAINNNNNTSIPQQQGNISSTIDNNNISNNTTNSNAINNIQSENNDKINNNQYTNTPNNVNDILDHFFGNTSEYDENENTVYNSEFEKELAAALGTTDISKVTEISDDHNAGNPFESEEDFMERVRAFLPVAGTDYGYEIPEKPKKINIPRTNAYIARPNLAPGEHIPEYDEKNTVQGKLRQHMNTIMNSTPTIPKSTRIK